MSMYRKEWECCGSVTETDAWEPESCPFCSVTEVDNDAARYRWLVEMDMLSSPSVDLAKAFATRTGSALDAAIDEAMKA